MINFSIFTIYQPPTMMYDFKTVVYFYINGRSLSREKAFALKKSKRSYLNNLRRRGMGRDNNFLQFAEKVPNCHCEERFSRRGNLEVIDFDRTEIASLRSQRRLKDFFSGLLDGITGSPGLIKCWIWF
jgi:hypothetical protein